MALGCRARKVMQGPKQGLAPAAGAAAATGGVQGTVLCTWEHAEMDNNLVAVEGV